MKQTILLYQAQFHSWSIPVLGNVGNVFCSMKQREQFMWLERTPDRLHVTTSRASLPLRHTVPVVLKLTMDYIMFHCLHHAFSVYTMHSLFTPCILCWLSGVGMTRFRLFLSDDIMRGHFVCRIKTLRCSSYRNNDQTVWQHDLHVYSIKANRFTTWLTFSYGYVVLLM